MVIILCKNCNQKKPHAAKGYCRPCYKKIIWRNNKRPCELCKRLMPMHAKGLCPTCYNKTFHRPAKEALQARRLYGIDYELWKKKTEKCEICGFDKIVDLHHLDKDHENRSDSNLIGLCPNHHRMIHKSETKQKILSCLSEKGFKV